MNSGFAFGLVAAPVFPSVSIPYGFVVGSMAVSWEFRPDRVLPRPTKLLWYDK
jgi:hypothetical protein